MAPRTVRFAVLTLHRPSERQLHRKARHELLSAVDSIAAQVPVVFPVQHAPNNASRKPASKRIPQLKLVPPRRLFGFSLPSQQWPRPRPHRFRRHPGRNHCPRRPLSNASRKHPSAPSRFQKAPISSSEPTPRKFSLPHKEVFAGKRQNLAAFPHSWDGRAAGRSASSRFYCENRPSDPIEKAPYLTRNNSRTDLSKRLAP